MSLHSDIATDICEGQRLNSVRTLAAQLGRDDKFDWTRPRQAGYCLSVKDIFSHIKFASSTRTRERYPPRPLVR